MICNEEEVIVYCDGQLVYSGSWGNADGKIKNSVFDWYLLDDWESADAIVIVVSE